MDVKKIMLLVGALLIAGVTAIMAKNMFAGSAAPQASAAPAVPTGPKVLVARKALPVGTIIDAEALAFQPWPKELMQAAYYTEGTPDADQTKLLGTQKKLDSILSNQKTIQTNQATIIANQGKILGR